MECHLIPNSQSPSADRVESQSQSQSTVHSVTWPASQSRHDVEHHSVYHDVGCGHGSTPRSDFVSGSSAAAAMSAVDRVVRMSSSQVVAGVN